MEYVILLMKNAYTSSSSAHSVFGFVQVAISLVSYYFEKFKRTKRLKQKASHLWPWADRTYQSLSFWPSAAVVFSLLVIVLFAGSLENQLQTAQSKDTLCVTVAFPPVGRTRYYCTGRGFPSVPTMANFDWFLCSKTPRHPRPLLPLPYHVPACLCFPLVTLTCILSSGHVLGGSVGDLCVCHIQIKYLFD